MCTQKDTTSVKYRMQKMDFVVLCTRERTNTNWSFYKFTTLTIFALLLKDVPMCCKGKVLLEQLLRNCNVNYFTFEKNTLKTNNENLCLF